MFITDRLLAAITRRLERRVYEHIQRCDGCTDCGDRTISQDQRTLLYTEAVICETADNLMGGTF